MLLGHSYPGWIMFMFTSVSRITENPLQSPLTEQRVVKCGKIVTNQLRGIFNIIWEIYALTVNNRWSHQQPQSIPHQELVPPKDRDKDVLATRIQKEQHRHCLGQLSTSKCSPEGQAVWGQFIRQQSANNCRNSMRISRTIQSMFSINDLINHSINQSQPTNFIPPRSSGNLPRRPSQECITSINNQ